MTGGFAVPDFISDFWHYYIIVMALGGILANILLLKSQTTRKLAPGEEAETLDPVFDGDLQEYNNPLPRWWLYMFWFLFLFGFIYLALYPGLGTYAGAWNWSSQGQYDEEKARVDAEFAKVFQPFVGQDLKAVAADPKAREMGKHLFLTYCSQCHGSGGQGSRDFPNLTDNLWLFGGGEAEIIKQTIADGRLGEMPSMIDAVGGAEGATEVANYILSLGGKPHDAALAEAGKDKFMACAGCHGEDGKGNLALSAPNLTDDAWMYGGDVGSIVETIAKGRTGGMPAHMERLGEAKLHLLAAYVYSLSKQ